MGISEKRKDAFSDEFTVTSITITAHLLLNTLGILPTLIGAITK